MYDYIIIGAGITGITLCKKLREKGITNILCLEKEEIPGGLCKTKNIDGHVLDIGGGHFFNTKHDEVFEYVFGHIPKENFNYYKRVSKIEIEGCTIDYPLESNLWQLPMEQRIDYVISTIRNGEGLERKEPTNYEEWIRWKLGDKICDSYMLPYNEKLWGVVPSQMDIDWLYKIPRVDVNEVLRYCFEMKQDVSKFPAHIFFYYPKQGGFQRIIDALAKAEISNIAFNEKVTSLKRRDDCWIVNNNYKSRRVINTTPWNDLYSALGEPSALRSDFERIKYNRIVVSLHEKEYDHDWHWRYVPDKEKAYHREFYIHNFADSSRQNGVYVETNIKRYDKGSVNKEFGVPIAEYITDAAYPIPVIGHRKAIDNILNYYRPLGLYGVGRWGQHQYQNADVSMHEAIKFVDTIVG